MKCIALTGGIATGKSTVSALLRAAGITVIDADVLAKEAVAFGSDGLKEITFQFGYYFLTADGNLDRKKMSSLIFSDDYSRIKLEGIVHPAIQKLLRQKLEELEAKGVSWVVYEAPLIFEKNMQDKFFATILVSCPLETQLERLMKRDKISVEVAQARINSQLSDTEKRQLATEIIDTNCNKEECAAQLAQIWQKITGEQL